VQVVDVPLGSVTLKVALARDRVGGTEPLEAMACRQGAVAAINGCFFDAYSDRAARNPYGNLVVHGEVVHLSDRPTTLGAWADGTVAIGRVRFGISGGLDGSEHHPDNWYAYGINDFPEGSNWAEIYTPLYGLPTSPDGGQHVVVRSGEIAAVGSGPAAIPRDGYVVHLRGQETYLAGRMTRGRKCAFRVGVKSADPPLGWLSAQEALGCGPLLVRDGKTAVDPLAEGFRDAKVLSGCCGRSALGLTAGGHLLLVTCPAATMRELGEVMKALGCKDAMNLDGGASSGLWLRGEYLTRPGRDVANALIVRER
jgi:exopolysaccharide biosynthesis protein